MSREAAWAAMAGGAGGTSGAVGCPAPTGEDVDAFALRAGFGSPVILSAPTQRGEQCCYAVTPICGEGRPLLVSGVARIASAARTPRWG